jgi:serine phosphatase RsbU (regulator of sigma subunit)
MKALQHLKFCFCFWKPSVARRITLYFTIFGLIIFYLTSVAYLFYGKKQLVEAVTLIVKNQLSRIPGSDSPDFLLDGVDKKQPELQDLKQLLMSLGSGLHTVNDVSIYSKASSDAPWHRMRLDSEGVLRTSPVSDPLIAKMEKRNHRRFVQADSDLYMTHRNLAMFIDLNEPGDRGQYYFKIDIARQGVACLFKNRLIYFLAISFAAMLVMRILGYIFARRLAAPVEALSAAAARVAEGDLSVEVPPMGRTEIGTLGENFNKMIYGLREWQRIKAIEMELEKGREIQQDFLPSVIPQLPNWDIATRFYPAREVSGDFYDVFDLPGGLLGLAIADVCDKGVGSALYMALIRSLIRVYAEQTLSIVQIGPADAQKDNPTPENIEAVRGLQAVGLTNNYLVRHHGEEGMFATLFFGVLDPVSGKLAYINGGHEPLYVIGQDGVLGVLQPTGPAVGLMEDIRFDVEHLQLGPGDLLLGFTDGVTEARSPEDELFTRQRLKDLLSKPVGSPNDLLEKIRHQLFGFIGQAPRLDDVTLLAVQRAT